jgi:hypothetical protein
VVAALKNYEGSCTVTSDTGTCTTGYAGSGESAYCCVCKP